MSFACQEARIGDVTLYIIGTIARTICLAINAKIMPWHIGK